ncbi:hypothetical protein CMK11_03520 [Candidatus Poribacteria bacterium]|nr:hypothetical protein [Candidatus Poribacteria bacterium]
MFLQYGAECALCRLTVTELLSPYWLLVQQGSDSRDAQDALVLCPLHHQAMNVQLLAIHPETFQVAYRIHVDKQALRVEVDDLTHLPNPPSNAALATRRTAWESH